MRRRGIIAMNQRGGAGVSAVIAIAILGACVFVGWELVPIFWEHWNLEDDVKTKMQFAFVNYRGDVKESLTKDIKDALNEMGAQFKEKDLKIKVDERSKKIRIEIWYSRTHKVPFYPPNPKQFYVKVENSPI